jgi:hypothetical protein
VELRLIAFSLTMLRYEIFTNGFAPWSTCVEYSPTLRTELHPTQISKITTGVLYQLFSDLTIRKIKLWTFENHTAPVKNVVDAIFMKCLGP